jgi:hypothetical protein
MRELAPPRRGTPRGMFVMYEESLKVRPPISPSSVEVRSILITPVESTSDLPGGPCPLCGPLEPTDMLDALLVRPLVFGSRSVKGIVPHGRLSVLICYEQLGATK